MEKTVELSRDKEKKEGKKMEGKETESFVYSTPSGKVRGLL